VSFSTPQGVEQAIKSAAKKQAEAGLSASITDAIQNEYRNRFLSRVFSGAEGASWVLKGGTGMLARIHDARATIDVDLLAEAVDLDEALSDLTKLVQVDLGDFFRFDYLKHEKIGVSDNQPNIDGYRVIYQVSIGVASKGTIKIDLIVGGLITGKVEYVKPVGKLNIPRLKSFPYRLYPLSDQVADKVCAVIEVHNGKESSRIKDLIDLVEVATYFDMFGGELSTALLAEFDHRGRRPPSKLLVPARWKGGYLKLSRETPAAQRFEDFESAVDLVSSYINPVLTGEVDTRTWSSKSLSWE